MYYAPNKASLNVVLLHELLVELEKPQVFETHSLVEARMVERGDLAFRRVAFGLLARTE